MYIRTNEVGVQSVWSVYVLYCMNESEAKGHRAHVCAHTDRNEKTNAEFFEPKHMYK